MEPAGTPLHVFAAWVVLGLVVSIVYGQWEKHRRDDDD